MEIPSNATTQLCQAAREAGAYVVLGLTERSTEASGGSLYNSLLYIDAQGDESTLGVYDTPLGRLGGLICCENYMPLARYALYAWGTQIYVAATWDHGEPWLSTVRHIAKEGRVSVIGCCMALRSLDIPDRLSFKQRFGGYTERKWVNAGDSIIVNPDGDLIAGPDARIEVDAGHCRPLRTTSPSRHPNSFDRILDRYTLAARIEPIGPHVLRHTFAYNFLQENAAGCHPWTQKPGYRNGVHGTALRGPGRANGACIAEAWFVEARKEEHK